MPELEEHPLSFSQVESTYRRAQETDPFFSGMTLQDFSRYMNKALGKPLYSAGDVGTFGAGVKRVSSRLDADLAPVSQALGGFGEEVGGYIGPRAAKVGRIVGETLPRSALDVGLFASAPLTGPVGPALALSSAAAKTYEETGSPVASAISAAALPATAGAISLARKPIASAIAKPMGEAVERALGPGAATAAERALEYGGSTISAMVAQEAANEAISKVTTGEFHNPFEAERLGVNLAGSLPFAALDVPLLARGYKTTKGGLKPANVVDLFKSGELDGATRSYAQHLRDQIAFRNLVESSKRETTQAPSISEPTHRVNQPQIQASSLPDASSTRDKVAAETKAAVENRASALEDVPSLKTPQDFVGWSAHHGATAEQTWTHMPEEVRAKVPGANEKEKIEWLKQERTMLLMGQKDLFESANKFTDEQLSGGLFGSVAVEQLGMEQPFGYKVSKDGTLPTDGVRRGMGKLLTKEELQIYSEAGLEEFLKSKGHKVGVQEMQKWLMENGPLVEVRKYGTEGTLEDNAFSAAVHRLESAGYDINPVFGVQGEQLGEGGGYSVAGIDVNGKPFVVDRLSGPMQFRPEHAADIQTVLRTSSVYGRDQTESATGRFQMVNPKPLDKMPGAVDILVKVPRKKQTLAEYAKANGYDLDDPSVKQAYERDFPSPFEKAKFSEGTHFPNDKNVLGFARGYMETLPDGTKVFHVFEVQSDWARAKMLNEASMERGIAGAQGRAERLNNPLLRNWERMVLKAAVKHALDNGAQRIAVSDADTAMLTEGHDRFTEPKVVHTFPNEMTRSEASDALRDYKIEHGDDLQNVGRFTLKPQDNLRIDSLGKANKLKWEIVDREQQTIRQEKGMRLHYDQLLPSILKELTGYEGVRTQFGPHQNAGDFYPANPALGEAQAANFDLNVPRQDLLLKNPDGTPKTSVSARAYGLDKAREELLRRGGYTFFGKDKLLPLLARMDKMGISDDQKAQALLRLQSVAVRPGEDLYDVAMRVAGIDKELFKSTDPNALMQGTHRFFRWLFWAHGETPDRIDALTRRALWVAARFGPLAGRYNIALASDMQPFAARLNQRDQSGVISLAPLLVGKKNDMALFESLVTLAHESGHAAEFTINSDSPHVTSELREAYERVHQVGDQLSTPEKKATIVSLLNHITGGRVNEVPLANIQRYEDPIVGTREFIADLTSLVAIGAYEPKHTADQIRFGDYEFGKFADGIYRDMASVLGVVEPALERVSKATGNKQGLEHVRTAIENINKLLVSKDEADRAVDAFLGMMERKQAGPLSEPPILSYSQIQQANQIHKDLKEAFTSMVKADWPSEMAFKAVTDEADDLMLPKNKPSLFGDRVNLWDRFKPIAQLVKKYPQLKETFNLAMSYMGISTNNTLALWNSFVDAKGRVDVKRLRRIAAEGSPMNNAIREVALVQNAAERVLPRQEREQRAPAYARLSEPDKKEVDLSLQQFGEVAVKAAIQRIRAFRTRIELGTARVIQSHNRDFTVEQATQLGQKVAASVFDRDTMDPAAYQQLLAEIQTIPISAKALESAMNVAGQNQEGYAGLKTLLLGEDGKGKPWYMPEVRVKDWHVAWKELSGKPQLWDFRTEAEASKKVRELQAKQEKGELEYLKAYNRQDKLEASKGAVKEEVLQTYADVEKRLFDSILNGLDKENPLYEDLVTELRSEYQPGDAAAALMTSPYMMERQLVGGRERLNFVEGMMHYIDATSHGISKQFVKQKQGLVLNDPQLRQNPNLRNEAKKYLSFVTDPQGKEYTALKNLVFFNYLGFNPSSLMIEGTQQFLTLVPHLIREGASIGGAYKLMAGAWHKIGQAAMNAQKKGVRLFGNAEVFADKELDAAVKAAISNRDIDTGIIQDMFAEQDVDFINGRNILSGNGQTTDYKGLLGKPLHSMLNAARHVYGSMTRMNSLSAFVAAYDHARAKGLKGEAAQQFAVDTVRTTMFGGGRITRPLAFQNMGSATGVGGLMYTLQSYTFSMLAMMSRLTREAITNKLQGPERTAALKAAGLMWGTQAVMGGVMGLPMVAASVALLERFFPEAEVRKNLRSAFVGLGGDDEAMGHTIADAAMGGVGNLSPVDFGSRFQLGNLFGISPYDGFSWKNLVGPSASLAETYAKGLSQAAQGKGEQALETVAPAGARNLVKLLTDGGAVRDAQERLVFEPTPTESVFMGLGFKPKRLKNFYEHQAISVRSERIAQQDVQDFYQDMAKRVLAGENQAVRDALYERQRTHPGFNILTGSRRIAELVQEMTVPRDLSRGGSRGTAAQMAETASLYPRTPQQSEVQRVLQRGQVERAFGPPGAGSPDRGALRVAQMVDQILATNPTLTRQQALQLVERALHPKTYQRAYGAN